MTWGEFARAGPELAARAAPLLQDFTLAYLATVRPDGSPRVHPVTITIHEDGLYAFLVQRTPKRADLEHNGRFALHSFPRFREGTLVSYVDDEFSAAGVAVPVDDAETRAAVAAVHNDTVHKGDRLFRLDLERAHHKTRVDGKAVYRRWRFR